MGFPGVFPGVFFLKKKRTYRNPCAADIPNSFKLSSRKPTLSGTGSQVGLAQLRRAGGRICRDQVPLGREGAEEALL